MIGFKFFYPARSDESAFWSNVPNPYSKTRIKPTRDDIVEDLSAPRNMPLRAIWSNIDKIKA